MTANKNNTKIEENISTNFIQNIIDKDLEEGIYNKVHTRFPPDPNGYLHLGHAKSICLNFGLAKNNNGECNLRFDDTNPAKEDVEYVESIKNDVKWLGFNWDGLFFASNYFDEIYGYAIELIKSEKAYVCDLSADEIREQRGNLKETGKNSPFRDRTVEENLDLFERMKNGEFEDGSRVLRAKINMESPNLNMRDPVLYRISHTTHHNTGTKWCIYPMYDFAHPLEDAIEKITHSVCTLEFEDHRPLYNWSIQALNFEAPPKQIEFARLNITNTVMSKRYLKALVDDGTVAGWDDPRMPTIAGLRRRGYTPESIRDFCDRIGVAKNNSLVDVAMLEHCIREDLKPKVEMKMVVIDPLKVTITNYPEGQSEMIEVENSKDNEALGKRMVPFSRNLYVEKSDFMENPPKKYFRLFPGNEVRFKGAYFIKCEEIVKDENGEVIELKCTYDKETKSGSGFTARKVKGTIHWIDANEAVGITVREYDHLMIEDENGENILNENSLTVKQSFAEPSIKDTEPNERYQFLRHGYYIADSEQSNNDNLVFNKTVGLKSSYKK